MERAHVDVCLHRVEAPGGVGHHLSHVHQVEPDDPVDVFAGDGAPAQRDEGGGEGRARGRHGRSCWDCVCKRGERLMLMF